MILKGNDMIRKIFISIGILLGIGIIGVIVWWTVLLSAFGVFDKDYSVSELKNNFYSREVEIRELKRYYNSIVSPNKFIEIEFENNWKLTRFGIIDYNSKTKVLDSDSVVKGLYTFLDWDIAIKTDKMDSLLNTIGWTEYNLTEIKKKLDNANCIGIESGEPTTIHFKRSGMGMYSFVVFDKSIPDSLKNQYNYSCRYILAGEKLVLEYGGGAVGTQCFYNLK